MSTLVTADEANNTLGKVYVFERREECRYDDEPPAVFWVSEKSYRCLAAVLSHIGR